jgi:hypothetical protein
MIFFKKVCDFTIPKRASMQGMVFLPKKKTKLILQDDFETAIRNQNLNISDGEICRSNLDKSQPKRTDNKTSVYW